MPPEKYSVLRALQARLQGEQQRGGAGGLIELFRDDPSQRGAFVGRGAHERHVGVVAVEGAVLKRRRYRLDSPEVDHVERAARDHLRHPPAGGGFEPVRPCAEDAADEFVAPFGGGHIRHGGDETTVDERFHGPPAAAGGVKDEHLVARGLQPLAHPADARRRHAEHGRGNQRLVFGFRHGLLGHPTHCTDGIGEDVPRNAVEPGDIDHRVHHRHVFVTDVGVDIARGDGGDHHLGEAHRQFAHRGRGHRRPARATQPQDAVDLTLSLQLPAPLSRATGHSLNRRATISLLAQFSQGTPAGLSHIASADVRR